MPHELLLPEIVEKAAKALYEYAHTNHTNWDSQYQSIRDAWQRKARAALEAALPDLIEAWNRRALSDEQSEADAYNSGR